MTDLSNPGQAADNEERPERGHRRRDPQHRIETAPAAMGLDDPHLAHHLGFCHPGREPLATFRIARVGKGQPIEPVQAVQAADSSPAHRTSTVEQYEHGYLDPASRAASNVAAIMLDGSATPLPAMSNAVP